MGVDFLERAGKAIKRGWDKQRLLLATPDLLTKQPEKTKRTIPFELVGNSVVMQGEQLTIETAGRNLIARRGLSEVLVSSVAPSGILEDLNKSCGVAVGTVENVHHGAGVVELSLR